MKIIAIIGIMTNNIITKIGKPTKYIPRDLEKTLEKYWRLTSQILAVVGPRRSGKTTLLFHLKEKMTDCIFLSFEDEDLLNLFENDIKSFAKIYLQPYQTIIFDEFQYAKNGGKNLKYLFDFYPGKKMIISGSSSIDLTIKAIKYLVGRVLVFPLYPFSFNEFLRVKNPPLEKVITEENSLSLALTKQIEPYLNEYLIFGGYPEVVLTEDYSVKKTLLENIYQLYFLKDVKSLTHLVNDWKLKNLVKILATRAGGIVNYNELGMEAKIDFKTLKSYLNFLEKTFIIFFVPPFFTNKTKEIVKNPKIYFLDLGLRNALINSFEPLILRKDKGFLWENFAAINLIHQGFKLHFWRTKAKAEVDFVIEKEKETIPIEVKSLLNQPKISRSFRSFIASYKPKKGYVFNLNFFEEKNFSGTLVKFVPFFHCLKQKDVLSN